MSQIRWWMNEHNGHLFFISFYIYSNHDKHCSSKVKKNKTKATLKMEHYSKMEIIIKRITKYCKILHIKKVEENLNFFPLDLNDDENKNFFFKYNLLFINVFVRFYYIPREKKE